MTLATNSSFSYLPVTNILSSHQCGDVTMARLFLAATRFVHPHPHVVDDVVDLSVGQDVNAIKPSWAPPPPYG